MKHITLLALAAALMISSTSCGKKKSGGSPSAVVNDNPELEEAPQELAGSYEALLRPLNTQVSGFLPSGRAQFKVVSNDFSVVTYLEDDTRVLHMQNIHVGRRCPTLADDANGDGLIDVIEMRKATGNVLIPLDGNLNSQMEGQDFYPLGKTFTYKKSGAIDLMFQDLYNKQLVATTDFTKLADGAPMNLEGKVVMIHGTSDLSRVPETVQTTGTHARNVTLPITCGVIRRMKI